MGPNNHSNNESTFPILFSIIAAPIYILNEVSISPLLFL
jgi:hypothetical protein